MLTQGQPFVQHRYNRAAGQIIGIVGFLDCGAGDGLLLHAERNAVMAMAAAGERQIEAIVCHGPYSGVPCAECRQVIWEFCCDDPEVKIIGSTLDGEIELMTIGEIYPSPYGPGTKGIDPRKF